jgi:hypothetical protein
MTFEEMSPDHQGCFLEAAALAMDLLANRKLYGKGRDAGLVRGTRQETRRPPGESQATEIHFCTTEILF